MDNELGNGDVAANEMLAAFGMAFFMANALEQDIINVMVLVWMTTQDHPPSSKEIGDVLDRHSRKTMGILLSDLKKLIGVEEALKDSLEEALDIRNWLAHRFFYDRGVEICTAPGKKVVTAELQSKASTLQHTRGKMLSIVQSLRDKTGITDDMLEQYHNELVSDYIDGTSRGVEDE